MSIYKLIPSMDELLNKMDLHNIKRSLSKKILIKIIKELQGQIADHKNIESKDQIKIIIQEKYDDYIKTIENNSYKKIINATGILLHTNLGRAPLSEIIDEISPILKSYTNLEMEINSNERIERLDNIRYKMNLISNFQDCLIVNNNAGAFFLICNTFIKSRKAIISRGELVEIGGSFRIPDILELSQASLKEVGTTNRTRISDFTSAIEEESMIIKVHKSNYSIIGHTSEVDSKILQKTADKYNILFYEDMGSFDFRKIEDIKSYDNYIISFSMDKMSYAVQGGIILGTGKMIQKLKNNPLYRTLRLSKFPLIYLDRYLDKFIFQKDKMISSVFTKISKKILKKRIENIYENLKTNDFMISIKPSKAEYGGGSGYDNGIESYSIIIENDIEKLNYIFRNIIDPPIIARIHNNKMIIDIASVLPEEDKMLIDLMNKSFQYSENELSTFKN